MPASDMPPSAEVRAADVSSMMAAPVCTVAAAVATAMTTSVSAAMTSAAAFRDRVSATRQQRGKNNKDGESHGPVFPHGALRHEAKLSQPRRTFVAPGWFRYAGAPGMSRASSAGTIRR